MAGLQTGTVRLSDFIARDMKAILATWDSVARSQWPGGGKLDAVLLRDHAEEILRAVIKDLRTFQSADDQHQKSLGRAPEIADAPETAAETHGFLRAKWGFDIKQLVAEYRALRAGVLQLWAEACKPGTTNVRDMMRFNEAIDQAIAESVTFFSHKLAEERNLMLGAVGHDMRSPLHVIHMSAASLGMLDAGEKVSAIAARICQSSAQLKSLLDDLVDFNRSNLGLGLSIAPVECDLAQLFGEALEQLRAGHPDREMEFQVVGDVQGTWDPHRLHQLLGNLLVNALKYGSPLAPVRVLLKGRPAEVEFSVQNRGPGMDESLMGHIFEPLVRGNDDNGRAGGDASLGLGLYIAREIAHAHGGDIAVRSDETETVFTVRLPRLPAEAPGS